MYIQWIYRHTYVYVYKMDWPKVRYQPFLMLDINVCTVYVCASATWGIYHTSALAACRFGVKGNRPSLSIQHYAQIPLPQLSRLCGQNFPIKYIQIYPNTSKYYRFVIVCIHTCISTNIYIYTFAWANYNISLAWIKAIWGWFPLLTMISRLHS